MAICAAVLLLFLGTVRDQVIRQSLFATFASALLCTSGALLAFLGEVLLASHGIRDRASPAGDLNCAD